MIADDQQRALGRKLVQPGPVSANTVQRPDGKLNHQLEKLADERPPANNGRRGRQAGHQPELARDAHDFEMHQAGQCPRNQRDQDIVGKVADGHGVAARVGGDIRLIRRRQGDVYQTTHDAEHDADHGRRQNAQRHKDQG